MEAIGYLNNAMYKVNSLIKRDMLKDQLPIDKREYHLKVTQKFLDYYNINEYIHIVMERIKKGSRRNRQRSWQKSDVSRELMPENSQITERPLSVDEA